MRWRASGTRGFAARVLLVAAAYFGSAKLGLALAYTQGNVTAVWPPTGIALGALVIWGYRFWPGVALGALLANGTTDVSVLTTLGITVGNTLEAVTGAALLGRAFKGPPETKPPEPRILEGGNVLGEMSEEFACGSFGALRPPIRSRYVDCWRQDPWVTQ